MKTLTTEITLAVTVAQYLTIMDALASIVAYAINQENRTSGTAAHRAAAGREKQHAQEIRAKLREQFAEQWSSPEQ